MIQTPKNLDEKYWLFGYDLPAETRTNGGLTEEQKTTLNTMRKNVWNQLRGWGCVPIQMSLWNIREPDKPVQYEGKTCTVMDALKQAMVTWREKYAKQGFTDVNLEIWPCGTDHVGANYIKNSEMRFVMEAVLKVEKTVDEGIKKASFKRRKYNDLDMRVEDMYKMFVEDFSTRHERWPDFEQIYMRVKRKMEDKLTKVLT